MKRTFGKQSISIFTLLFCMWITVPALAVPTVYLDNQKLHFEVPPAIEEGRTLVPLRAIFEALGATVEWDQSTQTATAVKGNCSAVIKIGSLFPTVNGQVSQLDVPAKIVNGRTLAPLRFAGEAFGGSVIWNGDTQSIRISSIPSSDPAPQTLTEINVHFINVGQADSIYIELPGENDILIDAGNVDDGFTVVNYLKAQGIDDIELLIATHPHEDHIGGLPAVLEAFNVAEIIDSGKLADSKIYQAYAAAAQAEGCTWSADNYQNFTWGNTTLKIYTGSENWEDINNYSVVCKLDTGDIKFLFMGDAETPVEGILNGDLTSDVLKVGYHGSNLSSSPAFLNEVNPSVAIICVGTDNTYGFPSPDTQNRLQAANASIYLTDLSGNIVVNTDGQSYSVGTENSGSVAELAIPAIETTATAIPAAQPSQDDAL